MKVLKFVMFHRNMAEGLGVAALSLPTLGRLTGVASRRVSLVLDGLLDHLQHSCSPSLVPRREPGGDFRQLICCLGRGQFGRLLLVKLSPSELRGLHVCEVFDSDGSLGV